MFNISHFHSYEDVADVVGEEPLPVEHGGDHLGEGGGAHVAVVLEEVHLGAGGHQPGEGQDVAPAAGRAWKLRALINSYSRLT